MNFLAVVVTTLVFFAMPSLLRCQGTNAKAATIYKEIPESQRNLLIQSVNKLILAERRGDWKVVYELFDKQPDETEEAFAKKMQRGHSLLDFSPFKVTFYPPNRSWIIQGCASFEGDAQHERWVASVHARWVHSRWYLSPVVIELFGEEDKMNPRACSIGQ